MFTGQIAMWSGTLGNIPAGWQLCDGTNGTPRLDQKFVIGSQGSLAIGDTGGNATHSHGFTTNGHRHSREGGSGLAQGTDYSELSDIVQVTGTTNPSVGLAPWYSLAFIMRMI